MQKSVWVCAHVHKCICMCVSKYPEARGHLWPLLLRCSPPCLYRQGLLLCSELSDWTQLSGQWALGILTFPLLQSWDYKHITPHPEFLRDIRHLTGVFTLKYNACTLRAKLHPQSQVWRSRSSGIQCCCVWCTQPFVDTVGGMAQ